MHNGWPHGRSWPNLGRFYLCLLLLLAARAGTVWILRSISRPHEEVIYFYGIDALAILLVSAPVLLWKPPRAAVLGLGWRRLPRLERRIYTIGALSLICYLLATAFLDCRLLIGNIHALLAIPVFEELLFRGYGWSFVSSRMNRRSGNLLTWLILSLLSAVWHYGCYQSMILPSSYLGFAGHPIWHAAIKGLGLGLLAGLARWKTGRVFGPILIHAVFNLVVGI